MATPSSSFSLPSFAAALPTTRKPRSPVAGVLPGPKVETCLRLRAVLSADRWAHPQSVRKHASADDRIRPARPHVADECVGDEALVSEDASAGRALFAQSTRRRSRRRAHPSVANRSCESDDLNRDSDRPDEPTQVAAIGDQQLPRGRDSGGRVSGEGVVSPAGR
jgi:hypothetical protein